MRNLFTILFNLIMTTGVNFINMIKSVPMWEKLLIVVLFIIPIPGTMEIYLVTKTAIIKFFKSKKQVA